MSYSNPTGLVSVTEIFSPYVTWEHISPSVLAAAADRGSRVHEALADDLSGDFSMLPADEMGYLDAGRKFLENIETVVLVEKRLCSEAWKYTGQIDLIAQIKGDGFFTMIDWKTSAVISKSWPLQLAAYRHLATKQHPIGRVMAVQLKRNGTFKINEYTNTEKDFNRFLNALVTYQYFKPKAQDINWESL